MTKNIKDEKPKGCYGIDEQWKSCEGCPDWAICTKLDKGDFSKENPHSSSEQPLTSPTYLLEEG